MKAKFYIAITIFLFWISVANSQIKTYNKSTLFELNGNIKTDVFLSFNFENRFNIKKRLGFGYKIGIATTIKEIMDGANDDAPNFKILFGLPLQINYFIGKENSPNIFEVGSGFTLYPFETSYFDKNYSIGNSVLNFSFMYRYQPINGGFTWHAGFTPIVNTSKQLVSCFTIGIGKTF